MRSDPPSPTKQGGSPFASYSRALSLSLARALEGDQLGRCDLFLLPFVSFGLHLSRRSNEGRAHSDAQGGICLTELNSFRSVVFLICYQKLNCGDCSQSSSWTTTVVRKWLHLKNAESSSDPNTCVFLSLPHPFCWIKKQINLESNEGGRAVRIRTAACSEEGTCQATGWLFSAHREPPVACINPSHGECFAVDTTSIFFLSSALIVLYNCCAYADDDDDDDGRRVFVGTWNVGGRPPHGGLNLRDWLEIVPLNAGNVLGPEDKGPAARWLSLIGQTLDSHHRVAPDVPSRCTNAAEKPRGSFSDLSSIELGLEEAEDGGDLSPGWTMRRCEDYHLVASKQMVGIFLCVWVRTRLVQCITSLKVSCVGRGIMGCMGNKVR
ncbi:hypothetical protein GW17_00019073 [Ensete ventricosum]|nr:hypothetical protein GW17_00019073 [Ensete ventricosum]